MHICGVESPYEQQHLLQKIVIPKHADQGHSLQCTGSDLLDTAMCSHLTASGELKLQSLSKNALQLLFLCKDVHKGVSLTQDAGTCLGG